MEVTQRGLREVRSFRKGVDSGKSSPYWMTEVTQRMPERDAREGWQRGLPERDAGEGCQRGMPERDAREGWQRGLPERDAREGCQRGMPERDAEEGCRRGMPERDAGESGARSRRSQIIGLYSSGASRRMMESQRWRRRCLPWMSSRKISVQRSISRSKIARLWAAVSGPYI